MANKTIQQSIYYSARELFDLAIQIEQDATILLQAINNKQLRLADLQAYQRILLFIITRSLKTYSSILLLCQQGFGQDVSTLLRNLLEHLITVHYILEDPRSANDKAARFVAFKWVIYKRQLPEQEKAMRYASAEEQVIFSQKQERILQQVDAFKRRFNISSDRALATWSGRTVKDMARMAKRSLLDEYETTFRLCSRFSHPSILGDKEYLVQDEQHLIFSPLPSIIGVIPNLKNAVRYAIDFLRIIDQQFDLQHDASLKELQDHVKHVLAMEQYQDPPAATPTQSTPGNSSILENKIIFRTNESP